MKKSNATQHLAEKDILHRQLLLPDANGPLRLYRYASLQDLVLLLASTVAALIAGLLHPTAPIVNAHLVEFLAQAQHEQNGSPRHINQFALYYLYIFFISLASWTIATCGFAHTAGRVTRRIKREYFSATLRQNMAVFDGQGTQDILSHLTSNTVQDALSSKLAISIAALGNLSGTIAVCFALDWMLGCILSWSFVLGTLVLVLGGKATARFTTRSLDASLAGSAVVEEALWDVKSTTALGLQRRVHKMYMDHVKTASKYAFIFKALNSAMISLCAASGYINVALGFWLGSKRLADGITPFTSVVAITIVLKSAAFVVLNIGSNLEAFNMAIAALNRISCITERKSPIDVDEGLIPEKVNGSIALRHVKHIYPHRQAATVLHDLSISFPAGKTVAIVGPSGSGKSSIASLILRFYNPVAGDITFDGRRIDTLKLRWLRQQIHLVSQEPFLFNTTVYQNIAHGLDASQWHGATEQEKRQRVYEAARVAQAHDFIEALPLGYDTPIGSRASRLSGGQAQRVAIARAIVGQPRVLIFDEATSALDGETETKLMASLEKNCVNCTKIIIAHRLSIIRGADEIVVLRAGQIAERGTHGQLMASRLLYFHLVQAQSQQGKSDVEASPSETTETSDSLFEKASSSDSKDELDEQDQDASLLASDPNKNDSAKSALALLRLGWTLNRPELKWVVVGLISSLIAGFEEPTSAILFGKSFVSISQPPFAMEKIRSETGFYSLLFFALAVVMFILLGAQGLIFAWSSEKMLNRVRSMALEKILRMEISFFDQKRHSPGSLSGFLSTSINDLAGISGSALSNILLCASTAACGIATAMVFGWKLTLLCLALYPALAASGYFGDWLVGEFETHAELGHEAAELASESLSGVRTIAALTMQDQVTRQFVSAMDATVARAFKANVQTSLIYAMAQAIYYAGMSLTFWYGGKLIIRHEYSLDQFMVVQSSMLMGAYSTGLVFSWTPSISKAKQASAMLTRLTSQESRIDPLDRSTSTEQGLPRGQVDFDCVTFFYPLRPNRAALKDVTFCIRAGSRVAFVGPTGSGKSSIISMIERFYDPARGEIRLDGKPLMSLNVAEYRRHVGFVGQDATLYNGTVKANLLLGLDEDDEASRPSDAAVEEACRQADIYDFIQDLPDGFDTMVGNRGTQLSVGQKQRLALARALIRQPAILLLDEATSALDAQSEARVHQGLERTKRRRTTVIVTHRLSTITEADCIYFIEQGSVVEAGTHSELLARQGRYYDLWATSKKEEKEQ
ncbi:hypothetical protein CDD81_1766 [Ophiocordyceps australis]|uniref:Uncharacterized protein n=1 Tax=Ophiocordyceps australis TaxID=1399860 RepID=A0A2C5YDX4_9HYPO|nr:hypothetical protein CDD81_1766 [Ophiocordyceps australis]